jgi:catechol 2,3-dioxygenase
MNMARRTFKRRGATQLRRIVKPGDESHDYRPRSGNKSAYRPAFRLALREGGDDVRSMTAKTIDPRVRIGHVHLKVAELERALAFYRDVLGFEITQRYGREAVFLSAGGYHHHIALNTWESAGGSPPPRGATGLYHLAILYPTRALLADALRRVLAAGIELEGASDHGVSEAIYLRDPDDNGVELYWDRPQTEWPRNAQGGIDMFTHPLNLENLLQEK